MKKSLLLLSASSLVLVGSLSAQVLAINLAESGRIMSSQGPQHLGGGNISGVIGLNDTGDAIVGDNGGNNLNFSLVVAFDTTADFRTTVANGGTVTFSGSTLYGVDDGFGGTDVKSLGSVDWAPISASVNAYGNSTTGVYSDANNFNIHAAFNLADANDANSQTAYNLVAPITFSGDPYAADTVFTVDMTTAIAALPLDATLDRVYLGLSAWTSDLSAIVSADSIADRVAFQASTFTLTAVPEPSAFALLVSALALVGVIARRRR